MTQARMFVSGDLPLFSGTAERGEVDAFRPEPAHRQLVLAQACPICAGTGEIDRYVFCSCGAGRRDFMLYEVRTLSDGTMAHLSGLNSYNDLTRFRAAWLDWVSTQPLPVAATWRNWIDCWGQYEEARTQ